MTDRAERGGKGLEAVLREAPWVRQLAGALVGNAALAEELSQDVLATALRERPGYEGVRLRGWLRTVARRLAGRTLERERRRRPFGVGS